MLGIVGGTYHSFSNYTGWCSRLFSYCITLLVTSFTVRLERHFIVYVCLSRYEPERHHNVILVTCRELLPHWWVGKHTPILQFRKCHGNNGFPYNLLHYSRWVKQGLAIKNVIGSSLALFSFFLSSQKTHRSCCCMGLLFYDSWMVLPHLCGSFQARVPHTCPAS